MNRSEYECQECLNMGEQNHVRSPPKCGQVPIEDIVEYAELRG